MNSFISREGCGERARGGRGARRAPGGRGGRGRDGRTEEGTREGERSRLPRPPLCSRPTSGRGPAWGKRSGGGRAGGAAAGSAGDGGRPPRAGSVQSRRSNPLPPGHPVARHLLRTRAQTPGTRLLPGAGKVLREREPGRSPGLLEAFGPPDAGKIFSSFSRLFAETFDGAFPRR